MVLLSIGQNYEKYPNYNNLELSFNLFPVIFKWASKTAIPAVNLGYGNNNNISLTHISATVTGSSMYIPVFCCAAN